MNYLQVPESPSSRRRLTDLQQTLNDFRKKSISELSLVIDALRGSPSPSGSTQHIHPERCSQSTGNLPHDHEGGKKRKKSRRKKVQSTWEALKPTNIQRSYVMIQEEKAMQAVPTAPIDASKFVAYVTERRKKRILFKGEYLMIQRSIDAQRCRSDVGTTMTERNPYPDTLPYDYNRVILPRIPSDENSHYINASYVNSWLREKQYVVTQAIRTKPMNAEFWRLIWEVRTNCIVMLTKVFDFMRVMCLQYWPMTKFQFGDIEVETLEVKTYAHFVIRTFRLTREVDGENQSRTVKHFHFTEWELDSFPYISAFIELRRRVRQYLERNPVDAPMVVHCSNGAGRSGAFLALDANLELMKKTGQLDVFEFAQTLVQARPHLIDSVDQYMFIYDVLAEAVLCNVAPIAMCELKDRSTMYKAKKDRQQIESQDNHENKLLLTLTPTLRIGDCAGGHRLENRGKNRDVMVVPPDHARPYLQTLHGESKDYTYINAVEVDGFTRKSEFIVTEWPKQATIDSFWTLIYDHSCHTVVNLSNQGNNKQFPTFIHNKGKHNYGPFIVEVLNFHQYPQMTSHMVKVMKRPSTQAPHKTSSLANLFKKEQPMKVPTIEGHPAFAPPPRTVPIGQSFRFKPEYQGRYRRKSVERSDSKISRSSSRSRREKTGSRWLLPTGKRKAAAKSADGRPRRSIVDVNDLFKEPHQAIPRPADLKGKPVSKLKGMSDIKRLMNVRKNKSEETSKQIEKLTFMISDIMSSGQSQQQMEAEVRICCVIQVRMWPIEHKVPLSTTGLIDVIKMARSWRKRAPDRPETKPTIVMSHNGVSRCGIYIGANICIDQMDMDHEVDVFHAVKLMRINRPQLIDMKDEYKYLYDVMLHWYMTNPEYRQFDKEEPIRGAEESAHSSRHASNRNSLKFASRGSSIRDRSLRGSRKENNSHTNHSNNILSRLSNR